MFRPVLEVADIFRAAGPAYRQAHAGHLSFGQLRGVRLQLVTLSGRIAIATVSYRADRIELRQPTGLAAGAYQIHLVGDASREILTRGNLLVTFR